MSSSSQARSVVGAIAGLVILASFVLPADAATKAKPKKYFFDDLVTPSMLAPPSPLPAARVQTGSARFFSINSVLAKLDGKAPPDQPVRMASAASDDIVSDAPGDMITVERPASKTSEPFGLFTFRAPESVLWRKWRTVKYDIRSEMLDIAACKADASLCSEAARRFVLMVDEVRSRNGTTRIETANRLVNTAIRYTSDLVQHGTIDMWTAPLTSLGSGRGDCEDYAIAKYVILREAGVPEQDLRILLVRDRAVREDHAVLAVREAGSWTVLDNRSSVLTADSNLHNFTPLVALDSGGVNLFASPYLTQRTNDGDKTVAPAAETIGTEAVDAAQQMTLENFEFSSSASAGSGGSPGVTLSVLM